MAEGQNGFFSKPTLTQIARGHDNRIARDALGYLIQRDVVAIPQSVRADRMVENFDVFGFALTE